MLHPSTSRKLLTRFGSKLPWSVFTTWCLRVASGTCLPTSSVAHCPKCTLATLTPVQHGALMLHFCGWRATVGPALVGFSNTWAGPTRESLSVPKFALLGMFVANFNHLPGDVVLLSRTGLLTTTLRFLQGVSQESSSPGLASTSCSCSHVRRALPAGPSLAAKLLGISPLVWASSRPIFSLFAVCEGGKHRARLCRLACASAAASGQLFTVGFRAFVLGSTASRVFSLVHSRSEPHAPLFLIGEVRAAVSCGCCCRSVDLEFRMNGDKWSTKKRLGGEAVNTPRT